jgi:hypothetical protein
MSDIEQFEGARAKQKLQDVVVFSSLQFQTTPTHVHYIPLFQFTQSQFNGQTK